MQLPVPSDIAASRWEYTRENSPSLQGRLVGMLETWRRERAIWKGEDSTMLGSSVLVARGVNSNFPLCRDPGVALPFFECGVPATEPLPVLLGV